MGIKETTIGGSTVHPFRQTPHFVIVCCNRQQHSARGAQDCLQLQQQNLMMALHVGAEAQLPQADLDL